MLDRRLSAFRPDLADEALRGRVEATRFVVPQPAMLGVPVASLRPKPDMAGGIDTQLLLGEAVGVLERKDGIAWVQALADGYVGYLEESVLIEPQVATHIVCQPRTFVYGGDDLKLPMRQALSIGSRLSIVGESENRGTKYLMLANGDAVVAHHLRPLDDIGETDYVAIAARFLETPYLWGGKSAFGIDCSGLVQLSMMMAGQPAPRDSDMQADRLGHVIRRDDLRRGDLVFWKGHVAIMEDAKMLLHGNGHTMSVARESLEGAIGRIGWMYGQPTGYRRPVPET